MHTPEMKPVDFDPTGLRVTPCAHCTSWWVELAYVDDRPVLREWHEATCTEWPDDPQVFDQPVGDAPLLYAVRGAS